MSVTRTIDSNVYHVHCNRHARPLKSWLDLPKNEQSDFDYVGGDDIYSLRFFEYRGSWYDSYEFERAGDHVKALGFDGFQGDSYFSATVVSYFDRDGYELDDEIIVGRIHW